MNRLKNALLLMILSFLLGAQVMADLPKDPEGYREWQSQMLGSINRLRAKKSSEAAAQLAEYVIKLNLPSNLELGNRPAFHAARSALVEHSHCIRYFQSALEESLQNEFREAEGRGRDPKIRDRSSLFTCLEHLQSPEVVALLGDLLEDDRDP